MAHLRTCWCGRIYRHESKLETTTFDWRFEGITAPSMPPKSIGYWWSLIKNHKNVHCPDEKEHGPPPQSLGVELIMAINKVFFDEITQIEDTRFLEVVRGY